MRIVFLNQYYPPDPAPTGVVLRDLAGQLAGNGHEVTVLCVSGDRTEASAAAESAGVRVLRAGRRRFGKRGHVGRVLDFLSYLCGAWRALFSMHPRPDRIIAMTTPPMLSVLVRLASRFLGAGHAHWVMDLYPDAMLAHGMLREGSSTHRLLAALSRWGMSGDRCAAVVTIGPDMAARTARLLGRAGADGAADVQGGFVHGEVAGVSWVPLWAPAALHPAGSVGQSEDADVGNAVAALRRERGWAEGETVVMYSGNIGLGHRFGEFLAAARAFRDRPFRFVFCGEGGRRREIDAFVRGNPGLRLQVMDPVASGMLRAHLLAADVHLASLEEGWEGVMVPSKLQGVFACGRPVVFVGPAGSSIARWVRDSGGGWVVGPGDAGGVVAAIDEAGDRACRAAKGRAALKWSLRAFDRATNVGRLVRCFGGDPGRVSGKDGTGS